MPDENDPPRKVYGFKPKEFERVNAPAGEAGIPTPPANDVFAIREELRAREIAAGLDQLAPPAQPRPNRRRRDFLVLMLAINGVLVPLAIWGFRTGNAVLFIYALSALVLLNIGVTWILWVLLDRY